jgi:hypothetical protein
LASTALFALLAGTTALAGCTDPDGSFDDFVDRIPDAAPIPDAEVLSAIPDITGRFFVGASASVSPDDHLLFIAENTIDIMGDTAVLSVDLTPVDYTTRQEVGDTETFAGIPVNMNGQFTATVMDVDIPAEANPITQSLLVLSTLTFDATIRSEDLYCGFVEGMVTVPAPIDLAGSTFAAIRVPDGAIGDDLPMHLVACPSNDPADAGVPDATPPTFDATPPVFDAAPPTFDATPPMFDAPPPPLNATP